MKFHYIMYMSGPGSAENDDYIILRSVKEEGTKVILYREFCRIRNRGRHSLDRAHRLVQKLNESPDFEWDAL